MQDIEYKRLKGGYYVRSIGEKHSELCLKGRRIVANDHQTYETTRSKDVKNHLILPDAESLRHETYTRPNNTDSQKTTCRCPRES